VNILVSEISDFQLNLFASPIRRMKQKTFLAPFLPHCSDMFPAVWTIEAYTLGSLLLGGLFLWLAWRVADRRCLPAGKGERQGRAGQGRAKRRWASFSFLTTHISWCLCQGMTDLPLRDLKERLLYAVVSNQAKEVDQCLRAIRQGNHNCK